MTLGTSNASRERTRVLIVDDQVDFANLIQLQLDRSGRYLTRCLYTGSEVVPAAEAWSPDIILLDFLLPDMDGGEVFQQLKNHPQLDRIPVILLTALAREDSPTQAALRTRRLTMAKPVDFKRLESCIQLLTSSDVALEEAV